MTARIDRMSDDTKAILWHDINEWGAVAASLTRERLEEVLPVLRARRLHKWVRKFGARDPRGREAEELQAVRPTGGRVHIVIPDTHAQPGQDLRRFSWLGRMVRDINPDVVVQIGDWSGFDSLCEPAPTLDRVKERTSEEFATEELSVNLFEAELGGWRGAKHMTTGNHDERPKKLANSMPWLEGLLQAGRAHERAGWTVHPFLEPVRVDGVRYQHYLCGKGSTKAISGKFHALRLLERVNFGESIVVGHSHMWQHYSGMSGKRRVHGLVTGCMFEHVEGYASEDDNTGWWRGATVLRNVQEGDFDVEQWSLARIRAAYGG